MTELKAPFCCYINPDGVSCTAPPVYRVEYGPTPDDYSEGCAVHIGLLIPTFDSSGKPVHHAQLVWLPL